jgi:hypothetical protein
VPNGCSISEKILSTPPKRRGDVETRVDKKKQTSTQNNDRESSDILGRIVDRLNSRSYELDTCKHSQASLNQNLTALNVNC